MTDENDSSATRVDDDHAQMTWEQKLQALSALSECSLHMRKPGNWYVQQATAVDDGKFLRGAYGNGMSPRGAVEDHWRQLTKKGAHVVVHAMSDKLRRDVTWNGFMWEDFR